MKVAVAGGTGVVGSQAVRLLEDRGHDAVVLSRRAGVDVASSDGIGSALDGVDGVLDVTNVETTTRRTAERFFTAVTRNLLDAGVRAGVRHHVVLSIVGVDRVPFGYYQGKRAQEIAALSGPVPASVLRTTQFHEFPGQLLARVPGPVAVVPRMRSQPIAAREVAEALVDLVTGEAVGMAPELAGPEVHDIADLARRLLQAQRSRRRVVAVRMPGAAGRGMAGGDLLPTEAGPRGVQTFEQWLAEQEPGR